MIDLVPAWRIWSDTSGVERPHWRIDLHYHVNDLVQFENRVFISNRHNCNEKPSESDPRKYGLFPSGETDAHQ